MSLSSVVFHTHPTSTESKPATYKEKEEGISAGSSQLIKRRYPFPHVSRAEIRGNKKEQIEIVRPCPSTEGVDHGIEVEEMKSFVEAYVQLELSLLTLVIGLAFRGVQDNMWKDLASLQCTT